MSKVTKHKRIFDSEALSEAIKDVEIDDEQRRIASEWVKKIKGGKLESETENYAIFQEDILVGLLGYNRKKLVQTAGRIGRQPDFAMGPDDEMNLCIEVKGTKQDLFKPLEGRHDYETPVMQATYYKGMGYKNAFCTNYKNFVLIGESDRYHIFDFMDVVRDGIVNDVKLQEFIHVFSLDGIDKNVPALITNTILTQKNITKKFYELFNDTRKMMIKTILDNSEGKTQTDAALSAQVVLNRMLFVFFADDRKLIEANNIFRNAVIKLFSNDPTHESKMVWNYIRDSLFQYFKDGKKGGDPWIITPFNGGLFNDEIDKDVWFYDLDEKSTNVEQSKKDRKFWEKDVEISNILKANSDLNPIIINLLKMENYDFGNRLGPNLLGNIFEKSMSDLEKIGVGGDYSRKKTGAYYTLENVTSYICRNTILPYLSIDGRNGGGGGQRVPQIYCINTRWSKRLMS